MSYQQNVENNGNDATHLSESTSKKRMYNNCQK